MHYTTILITLALIATSTLSADEPPATPSDARSRSNHLLPLFEALTGSLHASRAPVAPRLDENGIPEGYQVIERDIIVPLNWNDIRSTYATNLWINGVVPYVFADNVSNANRTLMLAAMAEWEAVANVQFVVRTVEWDYLFIRNSTQNSSFVGRQGGVQVVNIFNWNMRFVMCHELAHALGYWHEQSRVDRDAYVQINWGNIASCCGGSCDHNFQIQSGANHYGPYDFDSVMHYERCAFSIGCGDCDYCDDCSMSTQTITVLPPNEAWQNLIGQTDHLSRMDAMTMSFLYPESNWRFVDENYTGVLEYGSFLHPWKLFASGYDLTPTNGRLWMQPGTYSAVGVHSKAMVIESPIGGVVLGD